MYLDYKVSSGPFLRFSLRFEFLSETDGSVLTDGRVLTDRCVQYISLGELWVGGGWWVYLDYRVSSGPFLRFSMRFEFLSEI